MRAMAVQFIARSPEGEALGTSKYLVGNYGIGTTKSHDFESQT